MQLNEKIEHLRKNVKRLSKKALHRKLVAIFGEQAISYRSLLRIEKGERDGRLRSIHQIACGLDMDVRELLEGTEKGPPREEAVLADIIRGRSRPGRFNYNDKAYMDILSSRKSSFISVELVLEPLGRTKEEEAPEGTEIMLFVTKGRISVRVYTEEHVLDKGDSIYFQGHLPHHFENSGRQRSKAVIIQTPRTF